MRAAGAEQYVWSGEWSRTSRLIVAIEDYGSMGLRSFEGGRRVRGDHAGYGALRPHVLAWLVIRTELLGRHCRSMWGAWGAGERQMIRSSDQIRTLAIFTVQLPYGFSSNGCR